MSRMILTRCVVAFVISLGISCAAWADAGTAPEPLTASEAVRLALQNAPDLRQAELNLKLAQLELESAQNDAFLPSIGLSVDPPKLTSAGLGDTIGGSLSASLPLPWGSGNLTASVGLGYDIGASSFEPVTWQVSLSDLFDLAQPTSKNQSLASRKRAVTSAETNYSSAESSLILSTLGTYRSLLSEAEQAKQDSESVDQLQSELDEVNNLIAQGYNGDQDLNQAQLALLDAQIQAQKSEQAYQSDLESFCQQTLGLSEDRELNPLDLSMDDLLSASHDLLDAAIPETTIENAPSVISAQQAVDDADTALRTARSDALPSLSLKASLNASEWSLGVGLSFDLFAPNRWTQVEIAQVELEAAQQKLASATQSARNAILAKQSALLAAVQNGERLALEQEKWDLQEKVMTAKHDAGSLSDADWADFLQQKSAFAVDADGRAASLLVSYLSYRSALGLELSWEEWL